MSHNRGKALPVTPPGTRVCVSGPRCGAVALIAAVFAVLALAGAGAASAAGTPAWSVRSTALPVVFSAQDSASCEASLEYGCDEYSITATNIGTGASSGQIALTDQLPPGVQLGRVAIHYEMQTPVAEEFLVERTQCTPEETGATRFTCELEEPKPVPPGGIIFLDVSVIATANTPATITNHVQVTENGTPVADTAPPGTEPNTYLDGPAPTPHAGFEDFTVTPTAQNGSSAVQAGAHPAGLASTLDYDTFLQPADLGHEGTDLEFQPTREPKDEIVNLPPGLIGDPLAAERCTETGVYKNRTLIESCPAGSRIGEITLDSGNSKPTLEYLYNVTPEAGYPAEFGFAFDGKAVFLRARLLPSTQGYVLSVSAPDIPRTTSVKYSGVSVTFFGDPTERDGVGSGEAFLTNPDDCSAGPLHATAEMDSWVEPQTWTSTEATVFQGSSTQGLSDCAALRFDPSIQVTPETTQSDTPTGYEVDLTVPQDANVPGELATPDLKNAVVTLPEGVALSPGAANGLVACPASGPEGIDLGAGDPVDADRVTSETGVVPEGEEIGADGLVHPAPGHCPQASQIGEVEVTTPVLEKPLKGHVYIAAPGCGGEGQPACTPQSAEDGQLYGLYIELAGSGVIVKLKGQVSVSPATGRITTRVSEAPQLPFSELKLRLNGGQRAPLANPQTCSTASTTTDLTPWSTPYTPDATPLSTPYEITGCDGSPFSPAFVAGTTSAAAGAFSPFSLTFSRQDGEQDLSGLSVSMPDGLIGQITGIAECGEAEVQAARADTGSCPAASRVGTATAAVGDGTSPFYQSGPVFLTGPYDGAPFGLAVVVPADAGPFHLGNIVVRAQIHINPQTARVSVVSDPLPQMIDGVPLRIQKINVTVGEGGGHFTSNATGCSEQTVSATITSTQGAVAPVASRYAIHGCAQLPFKPVFTASTQGATSRSDGASLDVRIATKQGPDVAAGVEEANIRKVDVQLPLDLPSRLSTLQKACTEQQYAKDPAGCPEASFVGTAVAHTPLLPVPLEGPAILVSHAGAAFPDLDLVLQGDGVVIDLTGNTLIEHGITYSKFETAPDAPFSSFELKLPKGPHSILGSYIPAGGESFCNLKKYVTTTKTVTKNINGKNRRIKEKVKKTVAATLEMPTTITGQNGAVVKQTTKIAVAGCPTAATSKKASKAQHARSGRR